MSNDKLDLQRFQSGDDPTEQAQVWLEASQVLNRQGDLDNARQLLQASIQINPDCAEAWLRRAWLTEDPLERKALLRRVLAIEPEHTQAQTELARLQRSSDSPGAPSRTDRGQIRRRVAIVLAIAAGLAFAALLIWGPVMGSLAWFMTTPAPSATPAPTLSPSQVAAQFAPQLQTALSRSDWPRALELIDIMQGVDPSGKEVQQLAVATRMECGQALVEAGQPQEAQIQFDQVVALAPGSAEARLWQEVTQTYLAGEQAFKASDWDAAIGSFSLVLELLPGYGDSSARLVEAYRRRGESAIARASWDAALESLLQAHKRMPDDENITALLSAAFQGKGQEAMADERWDAAVEALSQAYDLAPYRSETVDLLARAYWQRGTIRYEKGKLNKAKADLEVVLDLQPDNEGARTYLDKVTYELFPPKRIEIDISEQHFYAWEGETLVYSFRTSTGLRGRDTATGRFRVLDKIPMAYSSIWRLKMPYWLGIYYVGRIENGIHALPIRPDGSVMWGGLLGQRASYGCVILSTEAARTIYDWADIGTPVHIHY